MLKFFPSLVVFCSILLMASLFPSKGNILFAQSEFYYFSPNYTLPGNAQQYPGNKVDPPQSRFQQFKLKKATPLFRGQEATEIIDQFLKEPISFPVSLEFSLVHHFNKPAGVVLYLESPDDDGPEYSFSYFAERDKRPAQISFYYLKRDSSLVEGERKDRFQDYWHHFIVEITENYLSVFHNGKLAERKSFSPDQQSYDLKIAAYLNHESHAGMGNILRGLTVHRKALSESEVSNAYDTFKRDVEEGKKYTSLFHFNAGPYLHFSTPTSINLLWETNEPAKATIFFGEELPLKKSINVATVQEGSPFIYEATIAGLKPDQPYFYNIKLQGVNGEEMESGILSFKTAPEKSQSILFGVIGDTEARPHINDAVSKKLWAERPEFVLLLGDLTDGGMKDAKWQWNLEYFEGMTQLFSRIPVFPVPGNGEGDLYWYKKYHKLPNGEAYYSFRYGNADFFVLNSNERKSEFSPGGIQYQWLDSALSASDAQWKFVALHHAPYSTDEDDYGNAYEGKSNYGDDHVKPLVPLFEKHKVDAVFFGHLHSYNRIGPIKNNAHDSKEGVFYIQAGGAGGNLEDFAPARAWFSQKNYSGHHYCTVSLSGGEFVLKTYNLSGELIDFLTINK